MLVPFSKASISHRVFQINLKILQIQATNILKIMKSPAARKSIFLIFKFPALFFLFCFFEEELVSILRNQSSSASPSVFLKRAMSVLLPMGAFFLDPRF